MPRVRLHQDLLFLVAAACVLALFLRMRSVDNDAHVAVVSAFEELQARESRRDHELLALRYGLSMNYDGLRAIEADIAGQRQVVELAPRCVEAGPGSELVRALAGVDAGLEDKARRIEDFVSDSAMLNNALRGLPKATSMVLESVDAAGEAPLAADLQTLVSSVFRYGLTGEELIKANAQALLGPLGEATERLEGVQKDRLVTALFLARTILDRQAEVDSELRAILALDGTTRIHSALESYLDAHGRIEGQIRATRWWLLACCLALLAWAFYKHAQIRVLNASIERKVIERTSELAASRELYRSLIESTQAVPWHWDEESRRFTYVGPQAVALLGCPASAWLEPGFWDARVHPEDGPAVRKSWNERRGSEHELEFRLRRDDGNWAWLRSIVSASRIDGNPALLQGFMLDITARRRIEAELQQAQKLESIGQLAAGIAHEINTPTQFINDNTRFVRDSFGDLAPLLACCRALTEDPTDEATLAALREVLAKTDLAYLADEVPRALDESLGGIARVASIVKAMKQFSHPGSSQMESINLNDALESTATIARNEWKYVAELELALEPDLPPVPCYPGELNQAVLNMIVNAAHAIGDVVKQTPGRLGKIRIETRHARDAAIIRISDTGSGIPEQIRQRIFDPFFTTKEVGKGTGQGLAIARSVIVDKHRGRIEVESEVGKGTTFSIQIPLSQGAEPLTGTSVLEQTAG